MDKEKMHHHLKKKEREAALIFDGTVLVMAM